MKNKNKPECNVRKKYAVYFEFGEDDPCDIALLCKEEVDRKKAEFRCPPWTIGQCHSQSAVRYAKLDEAIKEAHKWLRSSHINGGWLETAGVVPIDEGENVYRKYGQEVRIGHPIYVARTKTIVAEVEDYNLRNWEKKLIRTNKKNNTNPAPAEWKE